jgi:hypothetical protein
MIVFGSASPQTEQALDPTPVSSQLGLFATTHALHVCWAGMTLFGSVSPQMRQTLTPTPVSVQVGGTDAAHSPHWCALAILRVSVWDGSSPHVLVSEPSSVQEGSLITNQPPHWWTWPVSGDVVLSHDVIADKIISATANDLIVFFMGILLFMPRLNSRAV